MITLTPGMFAAYEWNCAISDEWVSNRIWSVKLKAVRNAALFATDELVQAYLGYEVHLKRYPADMLAPVFGMTREVKWERTPFVVMRSEQQARIFTNKQALILVDERMVQWFQLIEVYNNGRLYTPVLSEDGNVAVMVMHTSWCHRDLEAFTSLDFGGRHKTDKWDLNDELKAIEKTCQEDTPHPPAEPPIPAGEQEQAERVRQLERDNGALQAEVDALTAAGGVR